MRGSDDADAGFALTGDKTIMLSDDDRAFVMFGVSGASWRRLAVQSATEGR